MRMTYLLALILFGAVVIYAVISMATLVQSEEKFRTEHGLVGNVYPKDIPGASLTGTHYMIDVPVQWASRHPRSSSLASARNLNLPCAP